MAIGRIESEDELRAFVLQQLRGSDLSRLVRQLQGAEPFHVVGAAGEPAFENAWVNFGGGLSTAGFYKWGGRVWLKGQVQSGTAGAAIFTLPATYHPTERVDFDHSTTNVGFAITTGGSILPNAVLGNTRVTLDGLSFRLT